LLTILNNGIRYRVYQNNILVHDSSATTIPTSQFCIGRTRRLPDQVYWFDGLVSDAILWDRGLSANEVDQLYQIGRGGMLTPAPSPALFAFPSNPLAIIAASHAAVLGG
jgi:hypothetical protein